MRSRAIAERADNDARMGSWRRTCSDPGDRIRRIGLRVRPAAIALMLMVYAMPSLADEWEFRFTPYVWGPSLKLDTTIGRSRSASSDTSLLDVLDFAFLAAGEVRKGDWGVMAEFNYLALSDDFRFAGGLVRGESELEGVMGGAALAYRFLSDEALALDAFGGFRVWSLEATANFRVLPTASRSTTFVDPIMGLRGTYEITPDWFVSGIGEIGGFGVGSDFQWEVVGRLGYRFNDTIAVAAGYRHLALEVDRKGLAMDVAMTGPFVAVDVTW